MRLDHADIYETTEEGGLIAAQVVRYEDMIEWSDLTHRRAYAIRKVTRSTDKVLEFEDTRGRRFFLRKIDATGARLLAKALKWEGPTPTPGEFKHRVRKALNMAH